VYCFISFLMMLVSNRCCLDAVIFDSLQDLEAEEFEQQVGKKASVLDHVEPMLYSLFLYHTFTCMH
jgi:hypothetical protein